MHMMQIVFIRHFGVIAEKLRRLPVESASVPDWRKRKGEKGKKGKREKEKKEKKGKKEKGNKRGKREKSLKNCEGRLPVESASVPDWRPRNTKFKVEAPNRGRPLKGGGPGGNVIHCTLSLETSTVVLKNGIKDACSTADI